MRYRAASSPVLESAYLKEKKSLRCVFSVRSSGVACRHTWQFERKGGGRGKRGLVLVYLTALLLLVREIHVLRVRDELSLICRGYLARPELVVNVLAPRRVESYMEDVSSPTVFECGRLEGLDRTSGATVECRLDFRPHLPAGA